MKSILYGFIFLTSISQLSYGSDGGNSELRNTLIDIFSERQQVVKENKLTKDTLRRNREEISAVKGADDISAITKGFYSVKEAFAEYEYDTFVEEREQSYRDFKESVLHELQKITETTSAKELLAFLNEKTQISGIKRNKNGEVLFSGYLSGQQDVYVKGEGSVSGYGLTNDGKPVEEVRSSLGMWGLKLTTHVFDTMNEVKRDKIIFDVKFSIVPGFGNTRS